MSDTPHPALETAIAAARQAGEVIMRYYGSGLDVDIKSDDSPVTRADREAEEVIRETLLAAFPDHGIWGEEQGMDKGTAENLWLVDPLDGTKSFVRNNPMFSVQIALMEQDNLVLGVSLAPVTGELLYGVAGKGAWRNGELISISNTSRIKEASISFGNINTLAASEHWSSVGTLIQQVNRTRGYGDYFHYHLLATGALDAVIESDVNILDIAALSVIVTAAGGVFTDLKGRPLDLETRSVLASTPWLHAKLLEHISG